MKIIVERDRLKAALAAVIGHTKGASTIPILTHVLMEAEGKALTLTGNDLDASSQVTIPAEVEAAGSIAMPGDRFSKLVAGLPTGSRLSIAVNDLHAKVRCGRSSYQLNLLPAADFAPPPELKDPVTIDLSGKQLTRLFKTPAPCMLRSEERFYLRGIYLHPAHGKLAACATDGHTLLRAFVDIKPPAFDGVIVPEDACGDLARIADGDEPVTLQIGKNLIAAECGDRRYISKLVDATFPDYERVIPQSEAPAMTVDSEEMAAALARLVVACDPERTPVVKFAWSSSAESIEASLRTGFGEGEEEVDCECDGRRSPGEVGANIAYVQRLIEALGGERTSFFIDGSQYPIRVENPLDRDLVAVCMPCRF